MDDRLTRLAFRVQAGDVEAARLLIVEARDRQHAARFERPTGPARADGTWGSPAPSARALR